MSEFEQAITGGHRVARSVTAMESNRRQENRADLARVLLALGVLAWLSAFDKAGEPQSPATAQIEPAVSR